MMYPPLIELLEKADCRYALVVEVSKRARQLVEGAAKLTTYDSEKPVTIAIHEVFEGKIKSEHPNTAVDSAVHTRE